MAARVPGQDRTAHARALPTPRTRAPRRQADPVEPNALQGRVRAHGRDIARNGLLDRPDDRRPQMGADGDGREGERGADEGPQRLHQLSCDRYSMSREQLADLVNTMLLKLSGISERHDVPFEDM